MVKSLRATERVRDSVSDFIEKKLFLKANKEKTETGSLVGKNTSATLFTEEPTVNAACVFTRKVK